MPNIIPNKHSGGGVSYSVRWTREELLSWPLPMWFTWKRIGGDEEYVEEAAARIKDTDILITDIDLESPPTDEERLDLFTERLQKTSLYTTVSWKYLHYIVAESFRLVREFIEKGPVKSPGQIAAEKWVETVNTFYVNHGFITKSGKVAKLLYAEVEQYNGRFHVEYTVFKLSTGKERTFTMRIYEPDGSFTIYDHLTPTGSVAGLRGMR